VSVRFLLPSYLRPFADGAARLEFEGRPATVGAALDVLGMRHPGVRDRVLSEDGSVRPHVNVFVGDESIRYSGGLATPLTDGAEISIVPAVSGGAPARRARSLLAASLALAAVATCATGARGAGNADQPHPRLALYGRALGTGWPLVKTDGTLDGTVLDQIARYHAVVLSASPFTEYFPNALYQVRLRHLGIPLYAYVQPDYVVPASQPDSLVNLPTRQWILVRNLGGFLYDKSGGGFGDANVNIAKRANGRYVVAEALADFYQQAILSTGRWDGLFLDRFCSGILWQQSLGDSVDFVRAGYPSLTAFDTAWHAGSDTLANRLRRIAGATPVLVGNCAQSVQYTAMNGWAHENFPFQNGGTWDQNMFRVPGGYTVDEASFRAPQSNWLISWPSDLAHPYAADQVRRARFGLGTASLGDGFGTFNPSDIDPATGYMSWWYDEYAVDLLTGRASTSGTDTGWLGKALAPYSVIASVGPDDPASANPGFEADVSGWTLTTTVGATLARDATTAAVGVASGKAVIPAAGANPASTRLTSTGSVIFLPGPPWTASFWARAAGPRSIRVSLVDWFSGNEVVGSTVSLDGTWRRFSLSFTAPASAPIVRLQFQLGGAGVNVWVDDAHCVRTGINVYRREFERGTVLVNPTASALPVLLEQSYRRILGTVDPVTNDGSGGTQFTVPGNDALFLIRTSSLVGAAPQPGAPAALAWANAGPNPSSPGHVVLARLAVPASGRLTASVYDARGRRVRLLFDGVVEPGTRALEWDGQDEHGQFAPPGLYFLRAAQGGAVATRKLVRA
jgi:molybdopterin converting factor small subunit